MTYLKQYAINILIVKNKITTQHNILILSKSCIRRVILISILFFISQWNKNGLMKITLKTELGGQLPLTINILRTDLGAWGVNTHKP
jgi:hypothetical protein